MGAGKFMTGVSRRFPKVANLFKGPFGRFLIRKLGWLGGVIGIGLAIGRLIDGAAPCAGKRLLLGTEC